MAVEVDLKSDQLSFIPSKIKVIGGGGSVADAKLKRTDRLPYGNYDTKMHYKYIESALAEGAYPDNNTILSYLTNVNFWDGNKGGQVSISGADWRSFSTLLLNSNMSKNDAKSLLMKLPLKERCQAIHNAINFKRLTYDSRIIPESYFNSYNFIRFLSPDIITSSAGTMDCINNYHYDDTLSIHETQMDALYHIFTLNPELVLNDKLMADALVQPMIKIARYSVKGEYADGKLYSAWLKTFAKAFENGGARDAHLNQVFDYVTLLNKNNNDGIIEPSVFIKKLAKISEILLNAGAKPRLMASSGGLAGQLNAEIERIAPKQIAAFKQHEVERQALNDLVYNVRTLAEAIQAGDARKSNTFFDRVVAAARAFSADEPVLAAIQRGDTDMALKLLTNPNAQLTKPEHLLAQSVLRNNPAVSSALSKDETVVLSAMDEIQRIEANRSQNDRRQLAAQVATLGSQRSQDKLKTIDEQIAKDIRIAEESRIAQARQAREADKRRVEAEALDRKAYSLAKRVGDRVCKPGRVALGLIGITVVAYVEKTDGNRIQLRIHSTENQSIHYDGGALTPGKVIWDDHRQWKHCN